MNINLNKINKEAYKYGLKLIRNNKEKCYQWIMIKDESNRILDTVVQGLSSSKIYINNLDEYSWSKWERIITNMAYKKYHLNEMKLKTIIKKFT